MKTSRPLKYIVAIYLSLLRCSIYHRVPKLIIGRGGIINLKNDSDLKTKCKILESCVITTFTYSAQSWSLTKIQTGRLMKTERRMLRGILRIKLEDKINNLTLRNKFNHKSIEYFVKILKFNFAGHLIRDSKFKWTKETLDWVSYYHKRLRVRPSLRWRDEIATHARLASERDAL